MARKWMNCATGSSSARLITVPYSQCAGQRTLWQHAPPELGTRNSELRTRNRKAALTASESEHKMPISSGQRSQEVRVELLVFYLFATISVVTALGVVVLRRAIYGVLQQGS